MYKYSAEHLTALMLPPVELIRTAAKVGFDAVSIRFLGMRLPGEPDYDPSHQPQLKKDIKTALDETGLFINDIEVARITDDIDVNEYEPQIAAAAELGVREVLSSVWTTQHGLAVERFARLCELAKSYGLPVSLEFVTWSMLRNLADAQAFLKEAGAPANAGLLLDTLHMYRARTTKEQLAALPKGLAHFVHLCDGPAEIPADPKDHIAVGRDGRLYPGDGGIPLKDYLTALPRDLVLAVELPNLANVKTFGPEEHLRRCIESARKLGDSIQ